MSPVFEVHGKINDTDLQKQGEQPSGDDSFGVLMPRTAALVKVKHLRVQVLPLHTQVGVDHVQPDEQPSDDGPLLLHHQRVRLVEFAAGTNGGVVHGYRRIRGGRGGDKERRVQRTSAGLFC